MSDLSPTGPPALPEGRYGPERRPLPKPLLAVLLALAVLAVVPLTVAVYDRMNPPVRADVLGWEIRPNEVTVRVQVEKPAGSGATCSLDAADVSGEIVGSRLLELADDRTRAELEYTFPTASEAITVDVSRCQEVERG